MATKVNRKRAGRPKGSKTVYAGITAFCARHGYTHQHVRAVLNGSRTSAAVRALWGR